MHCTIRKQYLYRRNMYAPIRALKNPHSMKKRRPRYASMTRSRPLSLSLSLSRYITINLRLWFNRLLSNGPSQLGMISPLLTKTNSSTQDWVKCIVLYLAFYCSGDNCAAAASFATLDQQRRWHETIPSCFISWTKQGNPMPSQEQSNHHTDWLFFFN